MEKIIKFWTDSNKIPYGKVTLKYLSNNKAINQFLNNDIQFSEDGCESWIEVVKEAKKDISYFYDSFGNCCTTTVTSKGVNIENEYTGDIVENISLDDMKVILEKWLEFIQTRNEIEFSW